MSGPAEGATLRQRAFVTLQHLLPQHLLSRLVYRATRSAWRPWKDLLIRRFLRSFRVDMGEAAQPDPFAYATFNAFFTRALRPDARPLDPDSRALVCPVDGTVSQAGHIDDRELFQAKGHHFSLEALLAGERHLVEKFRHGEFATIYLAPHNYHRIHMPLAGVLTATLHVPGRRFSVNATTAAQVPGLFARNERVICTFDTPQGSLAMILVGALFVGSMSTIWTGEVNAASGQGPALLPAPSAPVRLSAGAEMGRFNMGSTVILLVERGRVRWLDSLRAGTEVRLGERIGVCLEAVR
jgi:phosphatidylserine decarboxylase